MPNTKEKLIELHKVLCNSIHCNYDEFQCAMTIDTLITAENLIANGVTVQKWIPVTEPPKENENESNHGEELILCTIFGECKLLTIYRRSMQNEKR